MSIREKLDPDKLPVHVAIIMDGNGRWAKNKGAARIFGHQNGVVPVHEVVEASTEMGIKYLTLYAFSTENWGRPIEEVNGLMSLLVQTIKRETKKLMKNDVRLLTIGDTTQLPRAPMKELSTLVKNSANNKGLTLILALSYSSRWEILKAIQKIQQDTLAGIVKPGEIDTRKLDGYLETAGIPDPEFLIRTSGEYRISNFLLYQMAYTELYFTPKFWPDFRKEDYYEALYDYQNRERRFGKTSEQL